MPPRFRNHTGMWHIMARGVNGCDIFGDDFDRRRWLKVVERVCADQGRVINAFVLMTNHVHILLCGEMTGISSFMQRLGTSYARSFNHRWGRYGPLYQGRFLAVPVLTSLKILEVSCYIHQNPVTAGMVKKASNFRWSSIRSYLGGGQGPRPAWLHPDPVLALVSKVSHGKRDSYEELMETYRGDDRDTWIEDLIRDAEAHLLV